MLTVFAAASLNEVFVDIAEEFEAEHDGVEVKFSFAGSSDLVSQLESGAPAHVFASANEKQMERAKELDLVDGSPVLFASNTLTLVTPADNPAGISSLLEAAESSLVICAPQVPCGAATEKMAEDADIALKPVSEENSVTDVLGKVSAGQADAGIVYVTDVARGNGEVEQVGLDGADAVVNRYPAAAVGASENKEEADEFVSFLRSDEAVALLDDAGFSTP